jgi:hypothetical protein
LSCPRRDIVEHDTDFLGQRARLSKSERKAMKLVAAVAFGSFAPVLWFSHPEPYRATTFHPGNRQQPNICLRTQPLALRRSGCGWFRLQLLEKPGTGHCPVPFNGSSSDAEYIGDLFDTQLHVEPKLNNASLSRI